MSGPGPSMGLWRVLLWSLGNRASQILLQIVVTMIMARLLAPAAFGVMAVALSVIRLTQYLTDLGLGTALIQKSDLTPRETATLMRWGVAANLALTPLLVALALGMPRFDPELGEQTRPILLLLSISPVIAGFGQLILAQMRREMNFRAITLIGLGAQLAGNVAIAVPLALLGWGIWSLAWGYLGQLLITALAARWLHHPPWHHPLPWREALPLLRLGGRFYLFRVIDGVRAGLPPLLVAALLGAEQTGYFDRLFYLVFLPLEYLVTAVSQVAFPLFSRMQHDLGLFRQSLLSGMVLLSVLLLPLAGGMAVSGGVIVPAMLGPQWLAAIPAFGLMAVWGGVYFAHHLAAVALEALGQPEGLSWQRGVQVVVTLLALALIPCGSVSDVLVVLLTIETGAMVWTFVLAMRAGILPPLWRLHAGVIRVALGVAGWLWLSGWWLAGLAPWPALLLQMGFGGAAFFVCLRLLAGQPLRQELITSLAAPGRGSALPWVRRGADGFARWLGEKT